MPEMPQRPPGRAALQHNQADMQTEQHRSQHKLPCCVGTSFYHLRVNTSAALQGCTPSNHKGTCGHSSLRGCRLAADDGSGHPLPQQQASAQNKSIWEPSMAPPVDGHACWRTPVEQLPAGPASPAGPWQPLPAAHAPPPPPAQRCATPAPRAEWPHASTAKPSAGDRLPQVGALPAAAPPAHRNAAVCITPVGSDMLLRLTGQRQGAEAHWSAAGCWGSLVSKRLLRLTGQLQQGKKAAPAAINPAAQPPELRGGAGKATQLLRRGRACADCAA